MTKRIICLFLTIALLLVCVLAIASDYGVWGINNYVDDFGDPTENKYIKNTNPITGTFSNSATTNSNAYLAILFSTKNTYIQLYEYNLNSRVKKYSDTTYNINVT